MSVVIRMDEAAMYQAEEYVPSTDSLDDGSPYDDGVNDFYLGDMEEDYPRETGYDCE